MLCVCWLKLFHKPPSVVCRNCCCSMVRMFFFVPCSLCWEPRSLMDCDTVQRSDFHSAWLYSDSLLQGAVARRSTLSLLSSQLYRYACSLDHMLSASNGLSLPPPHTLLPTWSQNSKTMVSLRFLCRTSINNTMLRCFNSLSRHISLRAALGTPSSSSSSLTTFRATISPVSLALALYTVP